MRSLLRAVLGLALLLPLIVLLPATPAHADSVTAMDDLLYQRVNPTSDANIVRPWWDEAAIAASQYGYCTDLGTLFTASSTAASGLTGVHRLWNATSIDFTDVLEGSSASTKAKAAGYVDQGVRYYALASAVSARTEPVNSYVKSGKHRLAIAATGGVTGEFRLDIGGHRFPHALGPALRHPPLPRRQLAAQAPSQSVLLNIRYRPARSTCRQAATTAMQERPQRL